MNDEQRVRDLLGQAFDVQPPADARPDLAAVRRQHGRRRAATAAMLTGGVSLVAVAVLLVPALLGGTTTRQPLQAAASTTAPTPGGTTTPRASLTPTVPVSTGELADGVTVGANGGVIAVPGKPVRWCPGGFGVDEDLVLYLPGKQPPATWCPLGVDVTGVDLGRLTRRKESQGVVWGYAYLRGVYRGSRVAVTQQTGQRQLDDHPVARWDTPPCPRPDKGWLTVGKYSNPEAAESTITAYQQTHPGELVSVVVFRPTPTSAVMVLAAEHPAAVRAALAQDASAVCVIPARYTSAQVTAARVPFENDMKGAGATYSTYGAGVQIGEDAQPTVVVQVARLTPELRALQAAAPKGLLVIRPWLTPIAADAPLPPATSAAQSVVVSSDPTDSGVPSPSS